MIAEVQDASHLWYKVKDLGTLGEIMYAGSFWVMDSDFAHLINFEKSCFTCAMSVNFINRT